jgi:hypothetical protein
MVTEAINTARAAGAAGELLVRGDWAYGNSAVVKACLDTGARFSVVLTKNRAVSAAIATIAGNAWTPVRYPGALPDPDTGELISDAEVAEVEFTAFTSTPNPVTARLIVRRVRDRNHQDALFPVWRYHPFFTNNTEPTVQADLTHRGHAIIETVFSDLIDGPLAHLPSGRFAANSPLGALRGDDPQPAARRGHPDRSRPRTRPRRDPAPTTDQRARTTGQTATTTRAAVAHALAPRPTMAEPVEQHLPPHTRPTSHHLTLSDTPHSPTKTGEAGQTSRSTMPSAG